MKYLKIYVVCLLALAACVWGKEKENVDLDDYIEKPAKNDKNEELATAETGYYGHQPHYGVSYHHHHQPHYGHHGYGHAQTYYRAYHGHGYGHHHQPYGGHVGSAHVSYGTHIQHGHPHHHHHGYYGYHG
ncbi:hypothetical protein Ocin01_01710 [Orchesella cincta]|uniref:Uncharacterized protein n=1 Tax=Orchesella cincta TaxID=48709 RepID=A0A1D2NI38_ORCCI|nr:hypothetical protein Ocin01_01710 [Orchesella cincta]